MREIYFGIFGDEYLPVLAKNETDAKRVLILKSGHESDEIVSIEKCDYSTEIMSVLGDVNRSYILNIHNNKIASVLRINGWHLEGDKCCNQCGLYTMDIKPLNSEGLCEDCLKGLASPVA